MKVIYPNTATVLPYEIFLGECFLHQGRPYLKVQSGAYCLESGEYLDFHYLNNKGIKVTPIKATVSFEIDTDSKA